MNRLLASALVLLALGLSACVSSHPDRDEDSDLPWNTRQSWEGAPGIPGFDGR